MFRRGPCFDTLMSGGGEPVSVSIIGKNFYREVDRRLSKEEEFLVRSSCSAALWIPVPEGDEPVETVPLENVYRVNDTVLRATVPASIPEGVYTVAVDEPLGGMIIGFEIGVNDDDGGNFIRPGRDSLLRWNDDSDLWWEASLFGEITLMNESFFILNVKNTVLTFQTNAFMGEADPGAEGLLSGTSRPGWPARHRRGTFNWVVSEG